MRRPFTMQEERKRILDMVENGTITAQEALALLEELGKQTTPVTPFSSERILQISACFKCKFFSFSRILFISI